MDEVDLFLGTVHYESSIDRLAFLDEHCSSSRLRRNVSLLLEMDDAIRRQVAGELNLNDPAVASVLDLLDASDRAASLGHLDRFEIVRVLGVHGKSVLLAGLDANLPRMVIVQMLAPSPHPAANLQAQEDFQNDVVAAAEIASPFVARVLGGNQHRGIPYVVMEVIVGRTLSEHLAETGPLPEDEIRRIGHELAQGLSAIHKAGLVHGSLAPERIVLTENEHRVRIVGLCLGECTTSWNCCEASAGEPMATSHELGYPSPERACDKAMDQRRDLFQVGVLLYTMATGRQPFPHETIAGGRRSVCAASPRPVREFNDHISGWLEDVILRLLAKCPEDRYQSSEDLTTRFTESRPSEKAAPKTTFRRKAFRLVAWTLTTAVAFILTAGIVQHLNPGRPMLGPVLGRIIGTGRMTVEADDNDIFVEVVGRNVRRLIRGSRAIGLPRGDYALTACYDGVRLPYGSLTVPMWGDVRVHVCRDELLDQASCSRKAAAWILQRGGLIRRVVSGDNGRVLQVFAAQAPSGEAPEGSLPGLPESFDLVDVEFRNLSPADFRTACRLLSSCKTLTTVRMADSETDGDSLRQLAKLKSLKHLDLTHLFHADTEHFSQLAELPALEELAVTYSPCADALCRTIPDFGELRILAIRDCPVTDELMGAISTHTKLESLEVQSRLLTNAAVRPLVEMSSLKELSLQSPQFDDGIWPQIAQLEKLRLLQLGSMHDQINPRLRCSGIQTPPSLRKLTLCNIAISETVLAEVASQTQLTSLAFHDSSFEGGSVQPLCRLERLDSLEFANVYVGEGNLAPFKTQRPECKMSLILGHRVRY